MELEELARLRHANHNLLEQLRTTQEEIKKRLPSKGVLPSFLSKKAAPAFSRRGKENQAHFPKDAADCAMLGSVEPGPSTVRSSLLLPLKPAARGRVAALRTRGGSPQWKRSFMPAAPVAGRARETSRALQNVDILRSPEHREGRKQSTFLRSPRVGGRPRAEPLPGDPGLSRAQGSDRHRHSFVRIPRTPKSILLSTRSKESKEPGRVTFLSEPDKYTIPADSWSVRPFLGYDWIAGLLDMDSSLSEKSEQFFSELKEFRRVNKEACVYEPCLESEAPDYLALEQGADLVPDSHKCVYCYRLNQRLFAVPVDSEAACPICKTPRTQRPPETLEEPAFVRVSIPRSTLLPAYKHKIHRRKSYEPADSLALPSHCLAGWENAVPSHSPTLSSLDLWTSLESKAARHSHPNTVSRVSGGSRTDKLLNLSHSTHFELSSASRQRDLHKLPWYRALPD
uniref:Migration and invasion inhibitory protein n=1 Tax=Sphenodon punctatus TaxID=8508 RepID=A0A8D0GZU7_SPHPU